MTPQPPADEHIDPESRLIDSLLTHALSGDAPQNEDRRVGNLLAAIRAETQTQTEAPPTTRRRLIRWLPLPAIVAAVVVIVAFLAQPGGSQNNALAAVERTIIAEQKPVVREYLVTIKTRAASGRVSTRTHTLFVRQREFVIRSSALIGRGDIWLGGQGDQRWFVPRFGPVRNGSSDRFDRSSRHKPVIETPFLNLSQTLERMSKFYDLQLTAGVQLAEGQSTVICDHVVGTRTRATPAAPPMHAELWSDVETGFAQRVELKWDETDKTTRWLEATAQLVGTPDVPGDFFDHTGHHDSDRKVVEWSE